MSRRMDVDTGDSLGERWRVAAGWSLLCLKPFFVFARVVASCFLITLFFLHLIPASWGRQGALIWVVIYLTANQPRELKTSSALEEVWG